ncbi:MAG: glycosyltransferase family 4 protein [Planctomycetia bacterium]|nr:glycosyltransferase family 4 protein [Planctomycetia bacterium]
MTPKPYCLFVTPFLPYPTGGGSAMRASIALEVLASLYSVIVVHPELWASREGIFHDDWVRAHSAAFFRIQPHRLQDIRPLVEDFLTGEPGGAQLDVVYAFRQVVAPLAINCVNAVGPRPRVTILDLDDDECARNEQFVPLHEAAGEAAVAAKIRAEIPKMNLFRTMLMPRFNHLLLASEDDCKTLRSRHPGHSFVHVPNAVRAPHSSATAGVREPRSILFVGSLDYLPNADAVAFFARSILPLIREQDDRMTFRIVGVGQSESIVAVRSLPGVQLIGAVANLATEYASAGMLVVPLRAGSGTRIKILEAFQHRTPVVSTTKGAEGLTVTNGEHLLIADTAEEFAAACLRLSTDHDLCRRLSDNAHAWVVQHHSIDTVRRILGECLNAPGIDSPRA